MNLDNYYLDYNATSPLVKPVLDHLAKGDLLFANPSSSHSMGKKSRRVISENSNFLLKSFNLTSEYNVIFHSGATEWINTLFNLNKDDLFIYFSSDHGAVCSVADRLARKGVGVLRLKIDRDGLFDLEDTIDKINLFEVKGTTWLNFTHVHNETGVIWNLSLAEELKSKTGVKVHVDAVQCVSKVENFSNLSSALDCYTFSSHKFGGPKSCGFSFVKKSSKVLPLIVGGGQQAGIRAGTENPLNAQLTSIALKHNLDCFSYNEAIKFREKLESIFTKSGHFSVVAQDQLRSSNTIGLVCSLDKSDIMLARFDMDNLFISSGSACSSGSVEPSRTLLDMGKTSLDASSFLRISFSPLLDFDKEGLLHKIQNFVSSL